jgi:hypothetical protein
MTCGQVIFDLLMVSEHLKFSLVQTKKSKKLKTEKTYILTEVGKVSFCPTFFI